MTGTALICGGSIAGLFTAAALRKAGWQVQVFERSGVELAGRGAGIVTHNVLAEALEAVGMDLTDLGVPVEDRVAYDRAGREVERIALPQIVTSWDRIHSGLRRLLPDACHHLGHGLTGYEDDGGGVTLTFEGGRQLRGDLAIGADGFRSALRAQMLPEVQPEWAGYVVWRALAQESDLPQAVRDSAFQVFGFHLPEGLQFIGYPIAGPGNDLRPGHRRYNCVWYLPATAAELTEMLTDAKGQTHTISIPPPLVRDDVIARMMTLAEARLAAPFIEILRRSERPFFTPIYDHHAPVMARGRVALAGDAACVARPHVGMGVTKAAGDALALARWLSSPGLSVPEALQGYSDERVPACQRAWARSRVLGQYLSGQNLGNDDGGSHPFQATIMRETAVMVA